ncbi:IS66 family transposase [Bacillus sp. FJAT-45350]|uniref:IS66 family transposase n=1 Tax=Bacillus sp. FJAT-45350 TaxID=2011014 RepID=UPI00211C8043|nr:IS66 family transposase [Bacillus sp. FJAT-45350]
MKKVQHVEHAYECKSFISESSQPAQVIHGRAPQSVIQSNITSPSVFAKVIHDKFALYLPLCSQVNEWERYGLNTNDKNLSNWVIGSAHDWSLKSYDQIKP